MVKVYYLDISKLNMPNCSDFDSLPLSRKNYLLSINDKTLQKQSYYVFKLLIKALDLNGISHKNEFIVDNNIWQLKSKDISFSLSHSKNIVAVAISKDFIGLDVEKIDSKLTKVEKLFNLSKIDNSLENITKLWTEKESLYKLNSICNLNGEKINIEKEDCNFNSKLINDNDNFQYYITLSSVKNIQCNFTKMELI